MNKIHYFCRQKPTNTPFLTIKDFVKTMLINQNVFQGLCVFGKRQVLCCVMFLAGITTVLAADSPTEGVITADFVGEEQMKADLLQMLADFTLYMKNDFQECVAPNSVGEACGCFKGENTMANDERGVRPNADLGMICAFLVKYAKGKVTLPAGVTWGDVEDMAMKSLIFSYSTHKANKLKVCSGNNYWGSTSTGDAVWESSLWAMSVAYSAFFQWERLSSAQRGYIEKLLKAECNYELNRTIPTGYAGDTKAEENGWEADVLAATLGLFPDDALAAKWFERLRLFAINSYSHSGDRQDQTVVDPDYDSKTVAQLYRGQNLYDDYTLQNHNYFHTSYQNVVMQELGEAALALKLFQTELHGKETWQTRALMHHNREVQTEVLNWLALTDGELAMPNGNDWSLFLYDQITSYSTNACFLRDQDALMLENLAFKYIKARQKTTQDGSWLLRADVGARRMGVEAHRVMMTWLMHHVLPTADLTATDFEKFRQRHSAAKVFDTQNIVRAFTKDRFTTFSWSAGLSSYTGYIAANSVDKNKIIVPYRANNTGNFIGWYNVSGRKTNASPVVNGIYQLEGDAWVMNGELNTNDATLNNRFAIYSTPGNAVIYIDNVRAKADCTITGERGGLMAISMDELTKTNRTFYYPDYSADYDCHCFTEQTLDGKKLTTLPGPWVNIDNELSVVTTSSDVIAFGDLANNNSIQAAKLYANYSNKSRVMKQNEVVARRAVAYYSNMTAKGTNDFFQDMQQLTFTTPDGWNGVLVPDGDGEGPNCTYYMLLSNFASDQKCTLKNINTRLGMPVFTTETFIDGSGASADFVVEENHSVVNTLRFFIDGVGLSAIQAAGDPTAIYVLNAIKGQNKFHVTATGDGLDLGQDVVIKQHVLKISIVGGELLVEEAESFPGNDDQDDPTLGYENITSQTLTNPNFEQDHTYGDATGNVTLNGVTYNPCYVNTVAAANSKWPNILPVKGWTSRNTLSGGSNFCRMYSMPYSLTMVCASPSNVGNYTAQTGRMLADDTCGDRTLTVLNSWDSGQNAITQTVSLQSGQYRLLLDMKYECPNQTSNDGRRVTTSGGNTNTSLTGVKIGTKTDYRYPQTLGTWEQMVYDFTLDEPTNVVVSLGYQSSAAQGAANNTLLYIDNVRLLKAVVDSVSHLPFSTRVTQEGKYRQPTYNVAGQRTKGAIHGIVIDEGRKIIYR